MEGLTCVANYRLLLFLSPLSFTVFILRHDSGDTGLCEVIVIMLTVHPKISQGDFQVLKIFQVCTSTVFFPRNPHVFPFEFKFKDLDGHRKSYPASVFEPILPR